MVRLVLVGFVLLAVLLASYAVARSLGRARWRAGTVALRTRLASVRRPDSRARFAAAAIEGLPAPVDRYFRATLRDGQPLIEVTRLRHSGTFDMGKAAPAWKPFVSDQVVTASPPGFDWDATIDLAPGIDALVHDAYVAGEGILHASVLGLLTVADVHGTPAAAEGELMRHLAEAPWSPTNLLPARGVRWTAIDETSAWATLADGATSVSLVFRFREDGSIDSVHADARPRTVGAALVPMPWEGRFWNEAERDGMRVPLDGEVGWIEPGGYRPYWRGHIEELRWQFTEAKG
jgi:hypothetical protein